MNQSIRLMWRLVVYQPWLYLAHGLAFALNNIAPLAPGLVVRAIFDSLADPGMRQSGVLRLIALLVAVAAGRAAVLIGGGVVDAPRAFYTYMLVFRNLLGSVLGKPGATSCGKSPGEAVTLFRDDAGEVEEVLSNVPDLAGAAISLVVAVGILLKVDARLTALVFLPLCAVIVCAQIAGEFVESRRRELRDAAERLTGALGEIMGAAQAIQVAGATESVALHVRTLGDARRKAALREKAIGIAMETLQTGTVTLGAGLIMLLAAGRIGAASLTVGDFSLFVSYLVVFGEHSVYLGGWGARFRRVRVAFDRMAEVLGNDPIETLVAHRPLYFAREPGPEESGEGDGPEAGETSGPLEALNGTGLTATYPGSQNGVHDADLELRPGTLTAVTGPVGSGKTTLLRAVLGLMPLEAGELLWNGGGIQDPSSFMAPPRAAYVPQVPVLLSGTVRENILLGCHSDVTAIEEATWQAVLEDDLAAMPDGLETRIGARGVRLSGGQVQRTAVARALVRRTPLVAMDDPGSSLDKETEQVLWDRILHSRQAATGDTAYLVVTRSPRILQEADLVLVMKEGRIIDRGKYAALLQRGSLSPDVCN